MLHVNRAWEPHVNQDLFISHTVSNKKCYQIPLENPYTWVTALSTIRSVTNTFIFKDEKTTQAKK